MKDNSNEDIVRSLIQGWRETRLLSIDWVNFHSIKTLRQKLPRIGLDSFAKHLIEITEVQKSYVNVIYGKKLDFSEINKTLFNPDSITKGQLLRVLKADNKKLYEAVNKIKSWDKPVRLFNKYYPLYYVIELLIRHETFHHGQFIAFCYSMNLKFPISWKKAWALPS